MVPTNRKVNLLIGDSCQEAQALFSSSCHQVLTNHLLKKDMNKLEAAGQLIQWVVELSEFDVKYRPKEAIKAQALADFIVEFTQAHGQQNGGEGEKQWIVHMDGSSTRYARGVSVILQSPKGDRQEYAILLQFLMTNNKTEYEALLQGLELAKSLRAKLVFIQGDSQLIIGQVNRTCEVKEE